MKPELRIICRLALTICLAALALPTMAQEARATSRVLITNVDVFDGEHESLMKNASVLVEGNLITKVSTEALSADGAVVIDGKGRTLMPGLIDAHWHVMYIGTPRRTGTPMSPSM